MTRLPLAIPRARGPHRAPVSPLVRRALHAVDPDHRHVVQSRVHPLHQRQRARDPWLSALGTDTARRAIADAERLGVKEIYFTGGEPFLHKDILPLLAASLAVAPTTVLTNGTLITEATADALAALAAAADYSLEIRVSLDDVDAERNDAVRGPAAWSRAVRAVRLLNERGLVPIVTATEILDGPGLLTRVSATSWSGRVSSSPA